ncbi:MAG TPA: sortase, partial [Rhodanobacteraceae bacterium]|nr:sortase [Rhodanobacteraceae bacterium]
VISAHRDTQFAFLRELRVGDTLTLDDARGLQRYRVVGMRVADSRRARPHAAHAGALLLVTCYPFDAVLPGGPLRYVVEAWPMAARMASISAL